MAAFLNNFIKIFIFCIVIKQGRLVNLQVREKRATQTTNQSIGKLQPEVLQERSQFSNNWRQHHQKSYDDNNDVVAPPDNSVFELYDKTEANEVKMSSQQIRKRRELSDLFIAPNTRWCGRGNIANGTYNYLGGASSADKCCRKHDHCQFYIPAMSSRYELFNYRPYTLSHCNCDRRFRTCLKMANDEDANTIGKLFFNMVQTQCFVLRQERLCQKRAEDGNCVREHLKQKAELRNNKKF